MRDIQDPVTIYKSTAVIQAAFTAAVATDLITSNAHGLSEGDLIQVASSTTLPSGLSASTDYYVINPTTNTFQVSTTRGGAAVDIADTGTGTHTYYLKGRKIYIGDWRYQTIHLDFGSTPTMTVKIKGSAALECPDFNAAQSATNQWDYVQTIDLQTNIPSDGDTGYSVAGTANNLVLAINADILKWITIYVSSWTAGTLGATITSSN